MKTLITYLMACLALPAVPAAAQAPAPGPGQPAARVHAPGPEQQQQEPQPPPSSPRPAAVLKVIATTPTYGNLARELGGDAVDVVDLCRATQDLHAVGATPSQMARLQGAGLVLSTGLDAEPWLEPMLRSSGNLELLPGSPRALALSDGIPAKEVPAELTRASGDIHAWGNPHVWTDPLAVRTMAARVRDALTAALPEQAQAIAARHQAFHDRLTARLVEWLTEYAPLKGRPVVTYHGSWPYLLDRFGLQLAGTVEPKPRVAPTASHLERLVETMRARHVGVVVREPYQASDATDFLAGRTGARVLVLSTHPEAGGDGETILAHFEQVLEALAAALDSEPDRGLHARPPAGG